MGAGLRILRNRMSTYPPRIDLAPGYSISRVIIGFWQLAGGHGPVEKAEAWQAMRSFVESGFTTFDCADIYTGVETLIGGFIERNRSGFLRGSLPPVQIHTKYVPDLDTLPYLEKAHTERVIDRSLKRLRVESLDLVQFHWWDFKIPGYVETAQHLADLHKAGKIRYLGVTNFDADHLAELLDAGVPVISNQVQYSLLDSRPEKSLSTLARRRDFKLLCYGTLAGGFLTDRWLRKDIPDESLENRSLIKYRLIIDEFGGPGLFLELLDVINRIAERHSVTVADVAMRYVLQKPGVGGVIAGARDSRHLSRLANVFRAALDDDDLAEIAKVVSRAAGPAGPVFGLERDRQGPHGRIMKYNLSEERSG